MFQEEFMKEMEKIRDRQMEIEEVEVKENSNNQ